VSTPAEPRVTCWWYVLNRGYAGRYGTMDWLLEIGRRAAGIAHWEGIPELKVIEGPAPGPYGLEWLRVHTWPERIFAATIAALEHEQSSAEWEQSEQGGAGWALAELAAGRARYRALTDGFGYSGAGGDGQAGWERNEAAARDVTLYPAPRGEQACIDIGYSGAAAEGPLEPPDRIGGIPVSDYTHTGSRGYDEAPPWDGDDIRPQ
jgi:hypothetical protein